MCPPKKNQRRVGEEGVLLRPGVVQAIVSLAESGAKPRLKRRGDGKCFADWVDGGVSCVKIS